MHSRSLVSTLACYVMLSYACVWNCCCQHQTADLLQLNCARGLDIALVCCSGSCPGIHAARRGCADINRTVSAGVAASSGIGSLMHNLSTLLLPFGAMLLVLL